MPEPGWYSADGDPVDTHRYWNGSAWVGEPVAVDQTTPTPGPATNQRIGRPATAGNRMLGRFIDAVINFAFVAVIVLMDLGGTPNVAVTDNPDIGLTFNGHSLDTTVEYLLWALFIFAWSVGWTHLKGGTPGKLVLKMRVTDEATGQMPVPLKQAGLRTANYMLPLLGVLSLEMASGVSLIGLLIGLVSLVLLFSDGAHRTVMDRFAKTVVAQL